MLPVENSVLSAAEIGLSFYHITLIRGSQPQDTVRHSAVCVRVFPGCILVMLCADDSRLMSQKCKLTQQKM